MSELLAFEPFSTLQGVLDGKPIKIMPLGTFYRDNRKLVITPERLQSFATNLKAGLPRFKVPINENHAGVGKVGTVSDVAYLEAGPDGAGLYATTYELTDAGKKLITDKRFDAVSPETVWTLNDGATYLDPQTGVKHDNVLVGLALTDRPFFGHDNVALFSDTPKRHNGYTKLKAKMKEQFESWLSGLTDDEPADTPAPETVEQPAAVEAATVVNGTFISSGTGFNGTSTWIAPLQGVETMTDMPVIAAEVFAVTKEAFDAMQADLATAKTNAEKLSADIKAEKHARRIDQLTVRGEQFSALPVKAADYADKMAALEAVDPELFAWVDGMFQAADASIATGDLFKQAGSARKGGTTAETINDVALAVLAEKFGGDMAHYGEAFKEAGKRRLDLAQAFASGQKD